MNSSVIYVSKYSYMYYTAKTKFYNVISKQQCYNFTTCDLVHTHSAYTYKNAPNLRKGITTVSTLCCCWHISSGNSCALENKLHTTLSELAVVGTKLLNKPCLNRCSANTASNGVEQVCEATLCTMRSPKSAI